MNVLVIIAIVIALIIVVGAVSYSRKRSAIQERNRARLHLREKVVDREGVPLVPPPPRPPSAPE